MPRCSFEIILLRKDIRLLLLGTVVQKSYHVKVFRPVAVRMVFPNRKGEENFHMNEMKKGKSKGVKETTG